MSNRPAEHEGPLLAAAHERRARLIAQLHEQAIVVASNELSALQKPIKAGITRRQKAGWIIAATLLKVIGAAILIAVIGCTLLGLW